MGPWDPLGARYFRHDSACRAFVSGLPRANFARALDAPGLQAAVSAFLAGDDRQAPIGYEVFALAVWWEQVVDGGIGIQASAGAGVPGVNADGAVS